MVKKKATNFYLDRPREDFGTLYIQYTSFKTKFQSQRKKENAVKYAVLKTLVFENEKCQMKCTIYFIQLARLIYHCLFF